MMEIFLFEKDIPIGEIMTNKETKKIVKIIAIIFVFFIGLCLFVGCKKESFEGEVCELEFKPAYTTTVIIPVTIYNGTTSSLVMIPYIRYYPDRWYVKVKEYVIGEETYTYYECYVTEEVYDSLEVGDWFVYDEEYCFPNEPYEQERK